MHITVTWYNVGKRDPHVQAAVFDMLREGISPSRVRIREVKRRVKDYFFQYGLSISALSDIYGEDDIPDDDDPIWEQMDDTYQRLGL